MTTPLTTSDEMTNDSSPLRPVVLGGGMAGIAASVSLAEAGLRPILIEARPYLGGRVRSFTHNATGEEIDNGQHLMMGCYHATFRLLDALGTRHLVSVQPTLHVEFRDADGRRDVLRAGTRLPAPLNILAGMFALRSLSMGERLGLLRVATAIRFANARAHETVRDFLTRLGQSARVQQRLWDPIAIATLNMPPEHASARLFDTVLRLAFLGGRDDSKLAIPRAGLSRLIEPASEMIQAHGGTVLTGMKATAITCSDNHYFISLADGRIIETDNLISALPSRVLGSIVGDANLRQRIPAPETGSSPIVSSYLWFDRPLQTVPELCALIGTNTQWVFNRRRMVVQADPSTPGLLSCTISAAFEKSTDDALQITAMAVEELRGAFPEIGGAKLLDALVVKERHATFFATPEAELVRPGVGAVADGFHLAGDWTATGLPATIEGAVISGYRAAELAGAQKTDGATRLNGPAAP